MGVPQKHQKRLRLSGVPKNDLVSININETALTVNQPKKILRKPFLVLWLINA